MSKPRIYLSPSNQGANVYAVGNTNEMHQCDLIAKEAEKALVRCGIEVMVGKSSDSMENRCKESDAFDADIHMPIHTNATEQHNVTGGTLVMLYKSSTNHNKAGKALLDHVGAISPGADYSLRYRQDLYELSQPAAMSLYLEVEFHDTKTGAEWIINNKPQIGEAIAKAMCQYFNVPYVSPKVEDNKSTTSDDDIRYVVKAGTFRIKDNAEGLVSSLAKAGFPAWIDVVSVDNK